MTERRAGQMNGDRRNFYDVLEVPGGASQGDIRVAYRRLAKRYHPDLNHEPGTEARFKAVAEAYEVLSDSQRRDAYDDDLKSANHTHPGARDMHEARTDGMREEMHEVGPDIYAMARDMHEATRPSQMRRQAMAAANAGLNSRRRSGDAFMSQHSQR